MALYRANPKDGVAWVTGASSGIGRALALKLAAQGYAVAVTARRQDSLDSLRDEAAGKGWRIAPFACDVTDKAGMLTAVGEIERILGPIVLAVFSAGDYFPTLGDRLDHQNIVKTFDVNLFGVVNGLLPVATTMRGHGRGQIVLVGSVSSYFGLPAAAAYGASKAALNLMAESLKFDFDKMNIRLQVINPGFVDTPLTEKNSFAMPFIVPLETAAKRMEAAILRGGFETSFPLRFTLWLKLLRILPQPLRFWLVNRATGWKNRRLSSDPKRG